MPKESILLYGEGKTEALFLQHLKGLYEERSQQRVKVKAGLGGSPLSVVQRMVKMELQLNNYGRSLLLLDSDVPVETEARRLIAKHGVVLVHAQPRCIEGLFLDLLEDLPSGAQNLESEKLKRRFRKNFLQSRSDREAYQRLKRKVATLFPRNLVQQSRRSNTVISKIVEFIEPE